jgi:hypothetical protein
MILAIVGIVHGFDLLPYYLSHYRALGVGRFIIACDPAKLDPSGALGRMLALQPDFEVLDLPRGFRRSGLVGMIEEEARSSVASGDDWAIPADLDELNQYPGDLRDLVRRMEQDGSTHLAGELRDRLASGGVLARLLPFAQGVSIWEQYPLEARVTARIAGGRTDKVLLSRGDLAWCMGHHCMREARTLRPFHSHGVAHHFKWRDGLAETLAWRVENEARARVPWSTESVRLSGYLRRHGRIVPQDVEATPGWRPESPPAACHCSS